MVKWQILSIRWKSTADTIKHYIKKSQGKPGEESQLHRFVRSEQRILDDF